MVCAQHHRFVCVYFFLLTTTGWRETDKEIGNFSTGRTEYFYINHTVALCFCPTDIPPDRLLLNNKIQSSVAWKNIKSPNIAHSGQERQVKAKTQNEIYAYELCGIFFVRMLVL